MGIPREILWMNPGINNWIIGNKCSNSRIIWICRTHLSNNQNDIELWRSFKKGNRLAFDQLFRRYYSVLLQYGSKICSDRELLEDAIQDLFVEVWQSPSQTQVSSVKAYFFKALKYKLFRVMKSESVKRAYTDEEDAYSFVLPAEHFIVSKEEAANLTRRIQDAVQLLPSRQREIVYLRIYQGMDYEQISDIMGINYQVARNLFYQSVKSLRAEFSK